MNLRTRCQIGLDFYEFLNETNRTSIKHKSELRDIYNSDFRNRDGVRDPNFSSILYALKQSNNAKVYSGMVHFKPKVRDFCQDQWQGPRGKGRGQKQQGASSSFPVQNGGKVNGVGQKNGACVSGVRVAPSSDPAQTSHTPRRDWRLANYILRKFKSDRAELISDGGGVHITSDHAVVDGLIKFSLESELEVYVVRLFLENSSSSPLSFTYYSALHRMTCFNLQDKQKVTRNNPLQLGPGDKYEVQLHFKSSLLGFYPATLVFEFKPSLTSPPFHLLRFIEAQYVTGLAKELAPTAPYRPRAIISATDYLPYTVEDGEPPESFSANSLAAVVRLHDYKVPGYVRDLIKFLNGHSSSSTLLLDAQSILESGLSRENYSKRLQLLLYLEELQMEVDIKRYNKQDPQDTTVCCVLLQVPGVSENRPSVLRGDAILVTRSGDSNKGGVVKYRGYVHRVELDSVKLGFSMKLMSSFVDGLKFDVEFTVSRLTTRLQQRATELAGKHNLGNVLFPSGDQTIQPPKKRTLMLYDRALEQNPEQYTAVQNIVAGSSRPAPYLVFGPPGTGNMRVYVMIITQVHLVLGTIKGHFKICSFECTPELLPENLIEFGSTSNWPHNRRPRVTTPAQDLHIWLLHLSHPSILKVPNELFYEEELQVFANEMIRNSYCNWEHLPQKNFPVVFHGVAGRDERESTSPSFFNVAEIEVLMNYLKKLLQGQGKRGLATISPKDIGIIAPYRKQVGLHPTGYNLLNKNINTTCNNFKDFTELRVHKRKSRAWPPYDPETSASSPPIENRWEHTL
uniref:Uncharacterized protein n=1 Tax=Hucho hucho TaxID=62062 RepID=A0A4W5LHS3_9TELE